MYLVKLPSVLGSNVQGKVGPMAKRLTIVTTSARPPAGRPVLTKKDLDGMRMHAVGVRAVDEATRRRLRDARISLEPGELASLLEELLAADARTQLEGDAAAASDRAIASLKEELRELRAKLSAQRPLRSNVWIGQVSGQTASPPLPAPGLAKRSAAGKKTKAA